MFKNYRSHQYNL